MKIYYVTNVIVTSDQPRNLVQTIMFLIVRYVHPVSTGIAWISTRPLLISFMPYSIQFLGSAMNAKILLGVHEIKVKTYLTKSNAASDLDAVNARLAILELTVQSLQQSLVTSSSLSPGNTQSSVPCQVVSNQSSWSSVVIGGREHGKNTTGTADLIKAVHKDLISQRERQKNIVVSGMKPSSTITDKDLIKNLIGTHLGIIPIPEPSFVRRLTTSSTDKIQPLLVCFPTETAASEILSQARNLRKSNSEYIKSNVYINRDLTKSEAAAAFEIREKRRIKPNILDY